MFEVFFFRISKYCLNYFWKTGKLRQNFENIKKWGFFPLSLYLDIQRNTVWILKIKRNIFLHSITKNISVHQNIRNFPQATCNGVFHAIDLIWTIRDCEHRYVQVLEDGTYK